MYQNMKNVQACGVGVRGSARTHAHGSTASGAKWAEKHFLRGIRPEDQTCNSALGSLFDRFVYAFDEEIRAAIEAEISKQMIKSVEQQDKLPFTSLLKPINFTVPDRGLEPRLFCSDSTKMVTIALCDYVINSASAVYYENGFLEWLVDELPQESWLNTHFWQWIRPQLYKKYPNLDMASDFYYSAAPTFQLQTDGATVNAVAELTLMVKTDGHNLPVACISLGTEDTLVPLVMSRYAKRMLPELYLHILEGHGHFS